MCSHYESVIDQNIINAQFDAEIDHQLQKADLWPGDTGLFISNLNTLHTNSMRSRAQSGLFGLVPHWSNNLKISRHTYNARSETAHTKPSFKSAWQKAQHCIIPSTAIFEPDWRTGNAIATRIYRSDGKAMGIAGLWDRHIDAKGGTLFSFTMLTINATNHPLMQQFHKPEDEKRMVVVLHEDQYADWLTATADRSMAFMNPYPAEQLIAQAQTSKIKSATLDLFQ